MVRGGDILSAELLKARQDIEKIELFEADWESLDAAKQNVGKGGEYHWRDLTLEAPRGPYNWINYEPAIPFRAGRRNQILENYSLKQQQGHSPREGAC